LVGLAGLIGTALSLVPGGGPARATSVFDPLNHLVVLMQENRSFDTYFGQLAAYQQAHDGSAQVEPEPMTGNPSGDGSGTVITPFHKTSYCEVHDLDHSWAGTHNEWDNGRMDGFARVNAQSTDALGQHPDPTGARAMGYYDATDLPYYYALYDRFAMSDTYFASVLSQTFPNRFYLLSGTSNGHIANDYPTSPTEWSWPSIFDRLDAAGVSWKVYFSEIPVSYLFATARNDTVKGHIFPISQYVADAAAGALPSVSFIDPILVGPTDVESDEHPSSNVQVGEKFVHDVVQALFTSPNWRDSALFLTYDEHGGFYDHLPPPTAPLPDNVAPIGGGGGYTFDHLGVRVPFVVVSPFAKRHYNSSALAGTDDFSNPVDPVYGTPAHVYSHTSILKTIEERFGLQALTARDASSNDLADLFDFTGRTAVGNAPTDLPDAPVDPAQAAACASAPPNGAP
jgi:phospholipase C